MTNTKRKGAAGERELAKYMTQRLGIPARRGQQFKGTDESPDVICDAAIHPEVKRVERINVEKALQQAESECGPDKIPVVAHRRNGEDWKFTVRGDQLLELAREALRASEFTEEVEHAQGT